MGFLSRLFQSKSQPVDTPYPGPYVDGEKASDYDLAYVFSVLGQTAPTGFYKPEPTSVQMNRVFGGSDPTKPDVSQVSTAVVAAVVAYQAWKASKKQPRK